MTGITFLGCVVLLSCYAGGCLADNLAQDQVDAYRGLAARSVKERQRQYGLDAVQLRDKQQRDGDRADRQLEQNQYDEDREESQDHEDGVN